MLNVYFILLLLGLALYMFEYTSRMTLLSGILAYSITGAWILFNWFYIRPRQIKKQQRKLDVVIARVEAVNEQLDG